MDNVIIRLETKNDYRAVENLTREAFWNVYKPGADEHYFVHTMRTHPDFIPELAFVLELDGEIVGNIMYTKAWLEDECGNLSRKGKEVDAEPGGILYLQSFIGSQIISKNGINKAKKYIVFYFLLC